MPASKDVGRYSPIFRQIASTPLDQLITTRLPLKAAEERRRTWYYFCKAVRGDPDSHHLLEGCNNRKVTIEKEPDGLFATITFRDINELDEVDKLMLAQMPDPFAGITEPTLGEAEVVLPSDELTAYQLFMQNAARAESEPQPSPGEEPMVPEVRETPIDLMYSTMPKEYTSPSVGPKTYTKEEVEAKGVRILDN